MSSEYGLTKENLLAALPTVLQRDQSMVALATGLAEVLSARPAELEKLRIYPQIDTLDEELLDILAYDLKVDWYNYNYPVEAKRELLKSSWFVHRSLGTKGAVSSALSAIYPNSTVQEWFEYGGEPYYFRIVVDLTSGQIVELSHAEIVKTVDIYKSLRSRLEDDAIAYRTNCAICVVCKAGYVVYGVTSCGTYPEIATQGSIEASALAATTAGGGIAYDVPMCGADSLF